MGDKDREETNCTTKSSQECYWTLTMNVWSAFLTTSASPKSMCLISSICDSFSDSHFDSLLSSSLYSCQLFSTSWSMVHLRCQKTKQKIFTPCETMKQTFIFALTFALSTCKHSTSVLQEPPVVLPGQRWRSHCCYRQLQQPYASASSLDAAASRGLPGKTVSRNNISRNLSANITKRSPIILT